MINQKYFERKENSFLLSVIILSYTTDKQSFSITCNCIKSLRESLSTRISLQLVIVESGLMELAKYDLNEEDKLVVYDQSEFNFHYGLNLGLGHSNGEFLAFCNNDISFGEHWAETIIDAITNENADVASPIDPIEDKLWMYNTEGVTAIEGYEIQKHFKGWCFVVKRSTFDILKEFDEKFKFYFADNDFITSVFMAGLKHIAVLNSKVIHDSKKCVALNENTRSLCKEMNSKGYKIPRYVITQNRYWLLQNTKIVEGLITYHKKWGSYYILKNKKAIVQIIRQVGLQPVLKFLSSLR